MEIDFAALSLELLRGAIGVVDGIVVALVVLRIQSRADRAKTEALLNQQKETYEAMIDFHKTTASRLSELVYEEEAAREKARRDSEITKYLDDPQAIGRLSEMFNLLHRGGGADTPELKIEGPALLTRIMIVVVVSVLVLLVNVVLVLIVPAFQ